MELEGFLRSVLQWDMDPIFIVEDDDHHVTVCCLLCGAMGGADVPDELDEDMGFPIPLQHELNCVLAICTKTGMIYN